MAYDQHYRSPFGDTTFTKVFVGGLAWETPTEVVHSYFERFGDILEAVIITDKHSGKSKGYGFVTFQDPESAKRACADPNPIIDGRRANCNIASLGRPRPRGGIVQGGSSSSSYPRPPPQLPPSPVIYPSYGYAPPYPPDYGFNQTMFNYDQLYGVSSSAIGNPYYYVQAPRGSYPVTPPQRCYYPTLEGPSSAYSAPTPLPLLQPPSSSTTDSADPPQTSTETEVGGAATSTA